MSTINFGSPDSATVSVLILTQREPDILHDCLSTVAHSLQKTSYEVLLLLNGAAPDVRAYVSRRVSGLRLFESSVNLGFSGGMNYLSRNAHGEFLLLLNDDTTVSDGWIDYLVETAQRRDAAVVGSRILWPDGRLQEAGSLIWSDGSTWPIGRDADGQDPAYLFERQVDYVSFCSVLIRRSMWQAVGGLDTRYFPAYYEDVDFALAVRNLGGSIWYQPASVIAHYESRATMPEFKRFLFRRNQDALVAKWDKALEEYPPPAPLDAAGLSYALDRSRRVDRRVLVVDDRVPSADMGSGFSRSFQMLAQLTNSGCAVDLYTTAGEPDDPLKVGRLGVEVLDPDKSLRTHLTGRRRYDCVIVSRPHNWRKVIQHVRRFQPSAPVIYDAEALWHTRLRSPLAYAPVTLKPAVERDFREYLELEETIAREADHVVAICEAEAEFFASLRPGEQSVTCMPPLPPATEVRTDVGLDDPTQRRGVLFVAGWLAGAKSPNGDGVTWLARNVLPLVVREVPWVRVLVTGRGVPPEIGALAGPNLVFLGHVSDLAAAHNGARVVIVPIRYGAGVKLKTMDALLNAVPLVSTAAGIEGVPLARGDEVDVADDPATFASAVSHLLLDDEYWRQKRDALLGLNHHWMSLRIPSWGDIVQTQVQKQDVRAVP